MPLKHKLDAHGRSLDGGREDYERRRREAAMTQKELSMLDTILAKIEVLERRTKNETARYRLNAAKRQLLKI